MILLFFGQYNSQLEDRQMNRKSSRSTRLLSTARESTQGALFAENTKLRACIVDLKHINLSYAGLLHKMCELSFEDTEDLTPREKKLVHVSQVQSQTINKLRDELKFRNEMDSQSMTLHNYLQNKKHSSIHDFIKHYEHMSGQLENKNHKIQSLEGTIGAQREDKEVIELKRRIGELQDKNVRSETKCGKLLHEMEETIKDNNGLKILTYDTEIKLREMELKDRRATRLMSKSQKDIRYDGKLHIKGNVSSKENECPNRENRLGDRETRCQSRSRKALGCQQN